MKSLTKHNAEARAAWDVKDAARGVHNGIACPECSSELIDSEPDVMLASRPPQKRVLCLICGFDGMRVA